MSGGETVSRCSACSEPMEARWRFCPHCGTAVSGGDQDGPGSVVAQWALRDRLASAFAGPFTKLYGRASASGTNKGLALWTRNRLSLVMEQGVIALADALPPALVHARPRILAHRAELPIRHGAPLLRLAEASTALREDRLPDDAFEALLKRTHRVFDRRSPVAWSVLAGSAIGSFLLPGTGFYLGGVVGAKLGEFGVGLRVEAHAEELQKALEAVSMAFEAAFWELWDLCAEGSEVLPSETFRQAEKAWARLQPQLDDRSAECLERARVFVETQGPVEAALHWWCHSAALQEDPASAMAGARLCIEAHPHDASSWAVACAAALEDSGWSAALEYAHEGLERDPDHEALRMARIEALGALGRYEEAGAHAGQMKGDERELAWLSLARGAVRQGDIEGAADAISWWQHTVGGPAVQLRFLADPVLREVASEPRFAFTDPDGDPALEIVSSHLYADGEQSWHEVPEDRREGLAAWLELRDGEDVLYLFDWTFLGAGLGGFVITSQRVAWKLAFEAPDVFELAELDDDEIRGQDDLLTIRDRALDLDREGLGEAVAQCVRHLAWHVRAARGVGSEAP